jgi:hypothetical protein
VFFFFNLTKVMCENAFKGRQPARRQATIKLKTLNRPNASDLIAMFSKKRGISFLFLFLSLLRPTLTLFQR